MPALPVIADTFRVVLKWTHATGQTAVNVLHIHDDTGTATRTDIYNALNTHVSSSMWGIVAQGGSVTEVDITPLDGSTATATFLTGSPSKWTGASGNVSDPFFPAGSGLLKLQTDLRGPAHRGRVFLPFVPENEVTDGSIDGSIASTVSTAWETFRNALLTNSPAVSLDVASYKHASTTPVQKVTCEPVIATQRRRQNRLR